MNKKLIISSIIAVVILVIPVSTANDNTSVEGNEPNQENLYLDHFFWGFIRGIYDIETYDKENRLVLLNEDYDDTIKVTGYAFYYSGHSPEFGFGSVKTYKVRISSFFGIHYNGLVFGWGVGIEYGW